MTKTQSQRCEIASIDLQYFWQQQVCASRLNDWVQMQARYAVRQ